MRIMAQMDESDRIVVDKKFVRVAELEKLMKELGMNKSQLARSLGISARQVSNWFSGRNEVPQYAFSFLRALAGKFIYS